jgi:putative thioredoxin
VTAADFEVAVVERSHRVPIIVDFWAEWCGPCKTLSPLLDRLAEEYAGGFEVAKVDTEAEPELTYAFQVRSIPFCVLMKGGRPVDAFAGAIGERDLRRFLGKAGIQPLEEARASIDPDSPEGRLAAARRLAAAGEVRSAHERLSTGIPEEDPSFAIARHILDGLEILDASLDSSGAPGAAKLAVGQAHMKAGRHGAAVEAFLESVEQDKTLHDGLARRAIVLALDLMSMDPNSDDDVARYRRRLATLLF